MKKLWLFLSVILCAQTTVFAAFPKPADSTQTNIFAAPDFLQSLQTISLPEFEHRTGKTLSHSEKRDFKLMQRKLRQLDNKELHKGTVWSAIGGFLLGFFLLPIGVLIAYLFSKDKTLRTWTWIGFGLGALILLFGIAFASIFSWN